MGVATSSFLSQTSFAKNAKSSALPNKLNEDKISFVNPDDTLPKLLKFYTDATQSKDQKNNSCSTCQNFTKKETRDGKEIGTCDVFSGKYVHATSVCDSWTHKT